ncbi:MAG: patatin-like phospholipase family protein [Bryobacteraceae bacterium]
MADDNPSSLRDALAAEYSALRPDLNLAGETEAELRGKIHAHPRPLGALCISGGGIRSATFGLGAIQGLAGEDLLDQFDYLSTVSGGGFVGGWLTAWITRAKGLANVIPGLCGAKPKPDEPDPIEHLREYNKYLSPRSGALSLDAWTLVATVVRNLILNWLVLIPLLLFALMAPRLALSVMRMAEYIAETSAMRAVELSDSIWVSGALPLLANALFMLALFNALRYLPGVGGQPNTTGDYMKYMLAPLAASTLLHCAYDSLHFYSLNPPETRFAALAAAALGALGVVWAVYLAVGVTGWRERLRLLFGPNTLCLALWAVVVALVEKVVNNQGPNETRLAAYLAASAIPCATAWVLYMLSCGKPFGERLRMLIGPLPLAIVLVAACLGAMDWVFATKVFAQVSWAWYVTLAPVLSLLAFDAAGALFVGLSSHALKDDDREWFSRAGAGVLLVCAVWLAACALVLAVPKYAFQWNVWGKGALGFAGAALGWLGARGAWFENRAMQAAAKAAPPAFLVLLGVGLAALTNWFLYAAGVTAQGTAVVPWWDQDKLLEHTPAWAALAFMAGFLLLAWVMAHYININKFSLHGMYRDRLIRAYLGASNPNRQESERNFTGFVLSDNLQMRDLAPRPFHVLNLTLNMVGGSRLAWQQRKAQSFTVSPLHCGSFDLGYRGSAAYGGPEGISLGTAVAISGAAASPSMGYHSTAIGGFVMTLLNARLGCWLGNPGKAGEKTWKEAGPRSAVGSLVRECFGLTNDRGPYVYLSDGGHFENLGLYEMVRRRCRHIVLLDAGCDPDYTFEDLGNALRKIRIDFGIPIVFDRPAEQMRERKVRFAVARIVYSKVDGACEDGRLVYVKPMKLGNEPPDVQSYAAANPEFPHQSTADQFFDESQTESYRMLGLFTMGEICRGWKKGGSLAEFCEHVAATGAAES